MKTSKDCLIGLSSAYISSDNASFIPVAFAARPPRLAQIFLPGPRELRELLGLYSITPK